MDHYKTIPSQLQHTLKFWASHLQCLWEWLKLATYLFIIVYIFSSSQSPCVQNFKRHFWIQEDFHFFQYWVQPNLLISSLSTHKSCNLKKESKLHKEEERNLRYSYLCSLQAFDLLVQRWICYFGYLHCQGLLWKREGLEKREEYFLKD